MTGQVGAGVLLSPNGLADLEGYKTMHLVWKEQVQAGGVQAQVKFVDSLFGLAA